MNKSFIMQYIIYSIVFIIIDMVGFGAIPGDRLSQSSFDFSLFKPIIYNPVTNDVFVGAQNNTSTESFKYKISILPEGYNFFIPLLTDKTNLGENNFLQDSNLYLFNSLTLFYNGITSMVGLPLLVVSDQKNIIYTILNRPYLSQGQVNTFFVKSDSLTDNANGVGFINNITGVLNGCSALVFTDGTVWSDPLNESVLYSIQLKPQLKTIVINNPLQKPVEREIAEFTFEVTKKESLFFANDIFKLGVTPVSLDNDVVMYSDPYSQKTYVGVSLDGGGRAVSMGTSEIAPQVAFSDSNNIVGCLTDNIKIHGLSSIFTSTGLSYLVVASNFAANVANKNKIFAIPLVNDTKSDFYGKLAKKDAVPQKTFSPNLPYFYVGNKISDGAQAAGNLFKDTDEQVIVGGEHLDFFDFEINKIIGAKDTVFISAEYMASGIGFGGIFYSQAIFGKDSNIDCWSLWRRHTWIKNLKDFVYRYNAGTFLTVDDMDSNSVLTALWELNSSLNTFGETTTQSISLKKGSVQGMYDIQFNHPVVDQGDKGSFLIQVGYKTVVLQQTATDGYAHPGITGDSFVSSDGTLSGFTGSKSIVCYGGELEKAGALITASAGLNEVGDDGWIFAGGSNGVFVLSNDDGSGIGTQKLNNDFAALSPTMKWKQLSSIKLVKKIIIDSGYLYVLTLTHIYRMALNASNILNNELKEVFSIKNLGLDLYASFSDFLVSGHTMIVASSIGLFKTMVGSSAKNNVGLEKINLPDSTDSIINLYPITRSQLIEDIARTRSPFVTNTLATSNIYILESSLGIHKGKIHRLVLYENSQSVPSTNETVFLLENQIIKDRPTALWDTKGERFSLMGDGTTWYSNYILSTGLVYKGLVELISSNLRSGAIQGVSQNGVVLMAPGFQIPVGPLFFVSGLGNFSVSSSLGSYSLK